MVELTGDEKVPTDDDAQEIRLEVVLSVGECSELWEGETEGCGSGDDLQQEEGGMRAEMEQREMRRLWGEEQKDMEVELPTLRIKVVSYKDQKI